MTMLTVPMSGLAEILADPTRPAEYQSGVVIQELPAELVDWRLTAIRISPDDRTAIVNNRIVREGDTVGPARIIEIQATGVVLDYNNRQLLVSLYSPVDLKKAVNNK